MASLLPWRCTLDAVTYLLNLLVLSLTLRIDNSRQSVFCGIRHCSVVIDCTPTCYI